MVKAADTDLFTGLIRSKGDAKDGSDDPAKPDDLIHAAAHNVNRDGKTNTAVGSARGVDSCVDTCSSNGYDSPALKRVNRGQRRRNKCDQQGVKLEWLKSSWARPGQSRCPPEQLSCTTSAWWPYTADHI